MHTVYNRGQENKCLLESIGELKMNEFQKVRGGKSKNEGKEGKMKNKIK